MRPRRGRGHGQRPLLVEQAACTGVRGARGVRRERWLNLELKLFADVALVGFPNVGKSTFVARVSAAKPKIADYPFTTLEPHLGVVRIGGQRDGTEFTAPTSRLIEGAAEGKASGSTSCGTSSAARVLLVLADLSPYAEHPPADQ